jgi:hypothetical protein
MKKQKNKRSGQSKAKPPAGPPPPPAQTTAGHPKPPRRWLRYLGHILAMTAFVATVWPASDWVYEQYGRTKPNVEVGSSDSSSQPSLPFTVKNTSLYFDMNEMVLNCAAQVSFQSQTQSGPVIITIGYPDFDPHPDGFYSMKVYNPTGKPIIGFPFKFGLPFTLKGGAETGNFHSPDVTSEKSDLKSKSSRPFLCDQLIRSVSDGNQVVATKAMVRADYVIRFIFVDWHRTEYSPVFNCSWTGGARKCVEGDAIPLASGYGDPPVKYGDLP